MTDDEQFWSTVRIANSAGDVKGCGFVVDSGHVMTCAHVVDFCRRSEPPTLADAEFFVVGIKEGVRFRLRPMGNARDMVDEDVAVLALDVGERFHDRHAVVRWEKCAAGMEYRGAGIVEVTGADGRPSLQSVEIDGEVGGLDTPTRHNVRAVESDLRIEAGCSGGAIFAKTGTRDLIGMVAEYKQSMAGTIVSAQALRDCWPELRQSQAVGNAAFFDVAPARVAGLQLENLDEKISRCNRELQTDPFRDQIRRLGQSRRGALLTTIQGQTADLPDRLSDRLCDLGPATFVRRKTPAASKAVPRPSIDIAKCLGADDAATRARIEYRLQDALQSERPDVRSFVKAIRKLGRPLIIEVRATEAFVAEGGSAAAAVWAELARELAASDIGHPLFVFFLVLRSGAPEGDALMASWRAGDPDFLVLEQLKPVTFDEIESWARSCYGIDVAEQVIDIVGGKAPEAGGVRLKQLQDWLSGA